MDKNSFTMIELLIVITIIALLSSLSMAYYNTFTEEKKLETAAQNMVDVLELAKKKAGAGDLGKFSETGTCNFFTGYQINRISSSSYELNICCSGTCDTANNQIQSYSTATTISNTFSPSSSMIFKPLQLGIGTTVTIKIKNASLNKCIDIDLNPAGLIQMGNKYTTGC